MFSLIGKRALVTGAGAESGIGFSTAKALKELGAQVVITATSNRVFDRAKELGVEAFIADLTDEKQVIENLAKISNLDILINNAGMTSVSAPAEASEASDLVNIDIESWRIGVSRNLDTAFLVTKHALPKLRQSSTGRIVMVSSVTGAVMAMRNGEISFVAPFRYTGMIWAILFGFLLFGDLPDAATILGTMIVIGMGVYAFHRERIRQRASASSA